MCVSVCMETLIYSSTYLRTPDLNAIKVIEHETYEPVRPGNGRTGFVFV